MNGPVIDLIEAIEGRKTLQDCDWHQDAGVEFCTSPGLCAGPACRAYVDEHLDALDDDGGMGEL